MGHRIIVQVEQLGPWVHAHTHRQPLAAVRCACRHEDWAEVGLGANQTCTQQLQSGTVLIKQHVSKYD